eukprot:403361116
MRKCTQSDIKYGFSLCDSASNNRTAFFYYDDKNHTDPCDSTSEPLPARIDDLQCDKACDAGQYLDLEVKDKASKCRLCPENTYSLPEGTLIDGLMGDWLQIQKDIERNENLVPIDFDCYYQNENFEWIENTKCTPWQAIQNTVIAGYSEPYDVNVAFKVTLTLYLEKNATIEFKYRKSTINSMFVNGEFKFLINNEKVLVDHNYQESDWQIFKYNMTQGAGKYAFTWIYSKYNTIDTEMTSEIEYISIYQQGTSALECLPCKKGQSVAGSSRCSLCEANYYQDSVTRECKPCGEGYYSNSGTVGKEMCIKQKPCTIEDIETVYSSDCDKNKQRTVLYSWIQPKTCNEKDPKSVQLPANQNLPCRNCGKGQYENSTTQKCQYCPAGFYQETDFHKTLNTSVAHECKQCEKGYAAPKILEYDDFESIPSIFSKECSLLGDQGSQDHSRLNLCDTIYGWRPTKLKDRLISGQGTPNGVKISLVTKVNVVDDLFGKFDIEYSVNKIKTYEKFSIYIDGEMKHRVGSKSNPHDQREKLSFPLAAGQRKIEISFESNKVEQAETIASEGEASIYKISLQGIHQEGASQCLKCADGFITNKEFANTCQMCGRGYEANMDQTACQPCVESFYNNVNGGKCKKCPEYTKSSVGNIQCDPFDVYSTDNGFRYNYQLMSPYIVCNKRNSINYCENNILGPIYPADSGLQAQDSFFISDFQRFSLRSYEYHETIQSNRDGYIFALFYLRNASKETLMNELDNSNIMDMNENCLDELKSIKIKKNLGQVVSNVQNFTQNGFSIYFGQGDICEHTTQKRYTSQINYVCQNETEEIGWPIFSGKQGDCHYIFEWKSYYACSQCTDKQIKTVMSSCNNGQRTYVNIPNDKCIIETTDGEYLSVYEQLLPSSKSVNFVRKQQYNEACQSHDEFLVNPMLQGLVIFAAIFFTLFFIAALCFYKKYKSLKVKYHKLGEDDGGEIEMQQTQ